MPVFYKIIPKLIAGLWELLREIGDQNAYSRYLKARGATHSAEEWRHFCDLRFRAKYRQAKCC
jgi:hypothetical protein